MKRQLLGMAWAIALACAFSAAVWAQRPGGGPGRGPGGPPPGAFGKITAINKDSLVVEMPDGKTQIIGLTAETAFARNHQDAKLADLQVGDFVAARGPRNENGQITAVRIFAGDKPPPMGERGPGGPDGQERGGFPPANGVRGKITAINGTAITIETPDGATQVINLTEKTALMRNREKAQLSDLRVGDFLGVQGQRNADGQLVPERVFASDKPQREGGRREGGPPPFGAGRPEGRPGPPGEGQPRRP